jgi:MFS transporter, FHS family, L-fucose permease
VQQSRRQYYESIAIIGLLFFIFGFVTWLNGTLIPFLKLACDLQSDAQPFLVTFAFYMAYFFLAIPSSMILRKTGYKRGMALGVLIMALGALLFTPAALSRNFSLYLVGLFVLGTGLALSQTACNPYISVVGPIESAARRISIMGICNKAAGVMAPLILSAILLKGASGIEAKINAASDPVVREQLLQELSHRVILPYLVMAGALALLALIIRLSPLAEIQGEAAVATGERRPTGKTSILQFPHLLLGAVCIFVYVAAEVMAGDAIGPYGRALGISLDRTKNFTAYTLVSMLVGYTIGILTIPKYMKQETALKLSALVGIVFSALARFAPGTSSIYFVALLGLANALMWPAIWPMAIAGLGRFTELGSALLIMGIAGGAIIPQIYSRLLVPVMPVQTAFFLSTLPCYVYILFYATKGYRIGRTSAVPAVGAVAAHAEGG